LTRGASTSWIKIKRLLHLQPRSRALNRCAASCCIEALHTPRTTLGQPLQWNNIGQRLFARLIKAAGVRRIKFHGLRHTSATLSLQTGTPVHVVAARLGHSKVTMTMEVYAQVLPDMQTDAAATLGAWRREDMAKRLESSVRGLRACRRPDRHRNDRGRASDSPSAPIAALVWQAAGGR